MLVKIRQHRGYFLLALVGIWWFIAKLMQGRDTMELSVASNTPVTSVFGEAAESIRGNRTKSPIFIYLLNDPFGFSGIHLPIEFPIEEHHRSDRADT